MERWAKGKKLPVLETTCSVFQVLFFANQSCEEDIQLLLLTLNFFSHFTESEIKRRSHLQLLNSKASLCVSSFLAISWALLPLAPYLMLK